MTGIGVQTRQVGNVVGGMILPFSIMNSVGKLFQYAADSNKTRNALQAILACVWRGLANTIVVCDAVSS